MLDRDLAALCPPHKLESNFAIEGFEKKLQMQEFINNKNAFEEVKILQ